MKQKSNKRVDNLDSKDFLDSLKDHLLNSPLMSQVMLMFPNMRYGQFLARNEMNIYNKPYILQNLEHEKKILDNFLLFIINPENKVKELGIESQDLHRLIKAGLKQPKELKKFTSLLQNKTYQNAIEFLFSDLNISMHDMIIYFISSDLNIIKLAQMLKLLQKHELREEDPEFKLSSYINIPTAFKTLTLRPPNCCDILKVISGLTETGARINIKNIKSFVNKHSRHNLNHYTAKQIITKLCPTHVKKEINQIKNEKTVKSHIKAERKAEDKQKKSCSYILKESIANSDLKLKIEQVRQDYPNINIDFIKEVLPLIHMNETLEALEQFADFMIESKDFLKEFAIETDNLKNILLFTYNIKLKVPILKRVIKQIESDQKLLKPFIIKYHIPIESLIRLILKSVIITNDDHVDISEQDLNKLYKLDNHQLSKLKKDGINVQILFVNFAYKTVSYETLSDIIESIANSDRDIAFIKDEVHKILYNNNDITAFKTKINNNQSSKSQAEEYIKNTDGEQIFERKYEQINQHTQILSQKDNKTDTSDSNTLTIQCP
jgi:hypothetical protein